MCVQARTTHPNTVTQLGSRPSRGGRIAPARGAGRTRSGLAAPVGVAAAFTRRPRPPNEFPRPSPNLLRCPDN